MSIIIDPYASNLKELAEIKTIFKNSTHVKITFENVILNSDLKKVVDQMKAEKKEEYEKHVKNYPPPMPVIEEIEKSDDRAKKRAFLLLNHSPPIPDPEIEATFDFSEIEFKYHDVTVSLPLEIVKNIKFIAELLETYPDEEEVSIDYSYKQTKHYTEWHLAKMFEWLFLNYLEVEKLNLDKIEIPPIVKELPLSFDPMEKQYNMSSDILFYSLIPTQLDWKIITEISNYLNIEALKMTCIYAMAAYLQTFKERQNWNKYLALKDDWNLDDPEHVKIIVNGKAGHHFQDAELRKKYFEHFSIPYNEDVDNNYYEDDSGESSTDEEDGGIPRPPEPEEPEEPKEPDEPEEPKEPEEPEEPKEPDEPNEPEEPEETNDDPESEEGQDEQAPEDIDEETE